MSISWFLQCSFTLSYISIVQTVPPDYCLAPLNRSDCDAPPRMVFSYYKPGSRCEQQTWRGCPTLNKFENEYLCSLNCIFRMRTPVVEDNRNPCDVPLNQDICEGTSSLVYTCINGSCEQVQWSGCPSQNKFFNKSICESVCKVPHVAPQIEKLFFELGEKPLKEINELLEHIIEEEATESANVTETDARSEPTTETQTETINVEPAETPADEPAETPAEEEPAETPAQEPAETPAEAPAEESAETPAQESDKAPAEEPAETPAEEPTENKNDEPEVEDEFKDFDYM